MDIIFQKSVGILKYQENKLIVEVDVELANYYRSIIPKYIGIQKPMYSPHISVVRKERFNNNWNKYQNKEIEFEYETFIYNDELYYWLNVYCKEFENIREELGLSNMSKITMPPDFQKCFHITLGNLKHLA